MPSVPEIDLAEIGTGSVTAPAGHGKTEVIAASIAAHPRLRFLVLTHTNAGVASLRRRVERYGIRSSAHIETISALALRLVRAFPVGIGWMENTSRIDYQAALRGALTILSRPTVVTAFAAGYDVLLVDEYQDCTQTQHTLLGLLAQHLPTVVLGDPLQAIFSFDRADPLVPWNDVLMSFPERGDLPNPHRWATTSPELGLWLKDIREPLLSGASPVATDPKVVELVELHNLPSRGGLFNLVKPDESTVVIIGNSARTNTIPRIAQVHSKLRMVVHEAADQVEVMSVCTALAGARDECERLDVVVDFLAGCITGVKALPGLTTALTNVRKSGSVGRSATTIAQSAQAYIDNPRPASLGALVRDVACLAGPAYRDEQLTIVRNALLSTAEWSELPEVARAIIDQTSHIRYLRQRRLEVGSTLRVKGLEYDHVILLDPEEVPTAQHLYVALTRACSRVTIARSPGRPLGKWISS